MDDKSLADAVNGIARHAPGVNWQENKALKEAARRLRELAAPARLLSYEEITQLPDESVVWEQWRGLPEEERPESWDCAPVARIGGHLVGNGILTAILPGMMEGNEYGQCRWWSSCPTRKQKEETPWHTPRTSHSPTA